MSTAIVILIFLAACLTTAAGLWAFLRIQPRLGLLDVPNERSSHTTPIPRGGGVVVVSVILVSYVLATYSLGTSLDIVFLVTCLLIAVVSLADDLRPLPLLPRLLTHFAAASLLVWFNGGYTGVDSETLGLHIQFGRIGPILSVLFIVWMINAYNFMDGIDGILGIQCLVAGVAWAVCGAALGSRDLIVLGTAISGSCLGFLFFNWQPAKVFMGDVGSTVLGFALATAPLISNETSDLKQDSLFALSLCFSTLFLFDTLYTRIALVISGFKFWLPHREHLYQKLVRAGVSHRIVSGYFGVAGGATAAVGLFAVSNGGIFAAAVLLVAAVSCLALFIWAGKKHIDVNIG